ncbi:hypothetical protein AVEN_27453-1 [Araneus ventricosus]|uniref:Fibrinogen C-terminal domain-containing protein n=2 Tax=Araneus ventricosus TaxID=182803 RepID=A0A4Y2TYE2_ARAVE|nr:hypothetical protein AVEN_38669-1 [Araneus ventricosus]GBO05715.1 hypothetical protein AVEN_27453-1 [Araneus ventricosus]
MERHIFLLSWAKFYLLSFVLLIASSGHCFMFETRTSRGISEIAREDTNYKEDNCKCILNPRPADCEEVLKNGNTGSGVYIIWPKSRMLKCETLKVYCDMETTGEGWTVY